MQMDAFVLLCAQRAVPTARRCRPQVAPFLYRNRLEQEAGAAWCTT